MADSNSDTDSIGSGSFVSIDESECRELLSVGVIGRIAFNGPSGIQLLPLNYFTFDENVYFRVDKSSELGTLAAGVDAVVFEVDHIEEQIKQAWSVVVKGSIHEVIDPTELESLRGQRRLEPWALGDRQLYLRLEPATITGRKVRRNARFV